MYVSARKTQKKSFGPERRNTLFAEVTRKNAKGIQKALANASQGWFRACAILTYERIERGRKIQIGEQQTVLPLVVFSHGDVAIVGAANLGDAMNEQDDLLFLQSGFSLVADTAIPVLEVQKRPSTHNIALSNQAAIEFAL